MAACRKLSGRSPGTTGPVGLVGRGKSGAVPAVERDVRFGAEGQPNVARGYPAGEGLIGRASAERGQHQITREYTTVGVAKLLRERTTELTQSHVNLDASEARYGVHIVGMGIMDG